MNSERKPTMFKRVTAYFIDMLIVALCASVISVFFPNNNEYENNLEKLAEMRDQFRSEEITNDEFNEFYLDISYELNKNSVNITIAIVLVSLLYFVLFNYYNDGQTFGKKLMKLKITSSNNEKLTITNYLIRSLIINSCLSNTISGILILSLSKANYLKIDQYLSTLFSLLYLSCFIMISYRNDGRGLHDILAKTKVVNILKNENNIEEKNSKSKNKKMIEAQYIEKDNN